MPIDEGFFPAEDGERLFYRFMAGHGHGTPLLLLHGHGEHTGRYLKFFDRLQDLGRSIATFDLRGCGQSGGRPVYVSTFEEYLDDVSTFLDYLKSRYGVAGPFDVLGHSLGGLIAAAWGRQNPSRVSRLILSSPLFGIPLSQTLKGLVQFLNGIAPGWVIQSPVRPPYLTHDPAEVERYRTDPLIRRRITVRLVHEMLRYSEIFQKEAVSFPFPVYILMAEEDFVVDPQATQRVFSRLEAPEKKLESFPGFYHEIFNEKGQERVFERLRYYLGRS